MFIIIGSDGVAYGPADVATIKAWLTEGRAVLQTRARRADSAEWKTLGGFAEFAVGATPPPLPPDSANKANEANEVNETNVEPARIDAHAYATDLIARAKPLDITGCIAHGWDFYKSDFGPILGVTLVTLLLAGTVPLVGTGFGLAGLYYYYLGKMRGQRRQLSDVFVGLQRMTMPLVMASVVIFAIVMVCMLPMCVFLFAGALMQSRAGIVLVLAGGFVCWAAVMYVSVVLTFTFPLIIDKNLDWKDALTVSRKVIHSQIWRFLGMLVLLWLISCLGLLAFVIGVYLLTPLCVAANAQAYEDLCNPPERERSQGSI
jgi:hypothetical protein